MIFSYYRVPRSSILKEFFADFWLTSSAHICSACRTHKHNRRESTSVIGSLIFASARRQAPRDCEYRYSMTALRANKTDNPPSERRCLSLTDCFSPSSLFQSASFVAYFCSLFVQIRAPM